MDKVAVIQMISSDSVEKNLSVVQELVTAASHAGAKLIVLPENFAFMGQEQQKLTIAEHYQQGPIQDFLANLAMKCQCWIVAGTLPLLCKHPEKVTASSLVFDSQGQVVARYDKIHLFDVRVSVQEAHHESRMTQPGKNIVAVDTPVGRIGLSVCYDVRFPELYRELVKQGADILVVPAAFTAVTGAAHWEILLRARAIENLSYVLAAAQGGLHANGRTTFGHSMIIDHWGTVLASRDNGVGVVTAAIDLEKMMHLRQQFPALQHRVL